MSFVGLKVKDIEGVARAVLPKFYAEDIHPESWRVFFACFNRCFDSRFGNCKSHGY